MLRISFKTIFHKLTNRDITQVNSKWLRLYHHAYLTYLIHIVKARKCGVSFSDLPLKIFQIRVPPMLLKSIKGTSSFCGFSTGNIEHAKHKKYVEYCLNVEYSIYVTNIEYRTIPLSLHAFLNTTQVYQILIIPLWLWYGLAYQATFKSTPKSLKMLVIKKNSIQVDPKKS